MSYSMNTEVNTSASVESIERVTKEKLTLFFIDSNPSGMTQWLTVTKLHIYPDQ